MRKLKTFQLLTLLTGLCMIMTGTSCSSDEPQGGGNELTYTQLAKADIQNASALILYDNDGSRASGEEFIRPGLYKIGPDGKISMVAIYCSTDEDGNKIETEHTLSVRPTGIRSCSKNYSLLLNCQYYDEDGSIASGAGYILLNNSTGDIYDLSEVMEFYANFVALDNTSPIINEMSDGSLLVYSPDERATAGRITLTGRKATFTQINNGQGFCGGETGCASIHITPSNLIFSAAPGLASDMGVIFPNGGYDYMASHTVPALSGIKTVYQQPEASANGNYKGFIWLNDSPVTLVRESYYTRNEANESFIENFIGIIRINVGNQSGQVTFTEGTSQHIFTKWSETTIYNACAIGDNLLVEISNYSDDNQTGRAYLVYNSHTDKWTDMGAPIKIIGNNGNRGISPMSIFNDRAWIVDIPEGANGGKVWWIDPDKQQTGRVDVDLAGVDIESIEEDYQTGHFVFRGVRRSDGSNCILTLDLSTGKSEILFSSPNYVNIDLVLLN